MPCLIRDVVKREAGKIGSWEKEEALRLKKGTGQFFRKKMPLDTLSGTIQNTLDIIPFWV
jgi:hypothetical protein